jgi:Cu/Ag efflux protein CusF
MKTIIQVTLVAALLAGPATVLAQQPVTKSASVTATFTITAINKSARIVTLKDSHGLYDDVYCGPDVQRFDALKVGDTVTFTYHESLVTAIAKAGSLKPAQAAAVTRSAGTAPGGTVSHQMTATVTIEAIDAKVPSVTIKTGEGHSMAFQIENAKNLEGYKVGDKVDITYTQALAVSVK